MARSRKPLTRRGVVARLLIGVSVAVAACPSWHALSATWLFPNADNSGVWGMRVYRHPDGSESFRLGGGSEDLPPAPHSIEGVDAHTHLLVWVSVRPPNVPLTNGFLGISEDRVLGAPIRHELQVECAAMWDHIRDLPLEDGTVAGYWLEFLNQLRDRPDLDRPSPPKGEEFPPVPRERIASAVLAEMKASPEAFSQVPQAIEFETKILYWPAIRWVGVRLALAVTSIAAMLYCVFVVYRARRLDWRNPPWCPRCRYALDPAMPRCPECGTGIRWAEGV